jgi:hypothetical protein
MAVAGQKAAEHAAVNSERAIRIYVIIIEVMGQGVTR